MKVGDLVQLNSKYFKGDMRAHCCGLVVNIGYSKDLDKPGHVVVGGGSLSETLPTKPEWLGTEPTSKDWSNNSVRVLWNGKIYWEYTMFLVPKG